MNRARLDYIRGLSSAFDDVPDGAYLGMMEEFGVDVDELRALAKDDERRAAKHGKREQRRRRCSAKKQRPK